ncbi:MAG: cytidylate kinase-like family protein [Crenarchaeota archaeon]|nr:cytidylate kinase-like family protein [Thermoproteota archaeon]MDW8034193.1 cytidylate kinase family protein [Nitrososphaerota archaeon]
MSRDKPVILIAGELGAGCTEVGELISQKLGLEVYNTEKLIRNLVSSPTLSYKALVDKSISGEIEIEKVLYSMVLDIVKNGPAIIEGRSALMALAHEADLKVFLYREMKDRVKHLAERRKTDDPKQIEEDIKASDIDRNSLVEKLFHKNWRDPLLYDLMINTSKISFEDSVSLILEALKSRK